MRTPDPAFDFDADLDPVSYSEEDSDPASQNDADPDPQHCQPTLIIPGTDDRTFSTSNLVKLNHPNSKKPTEQPQAITIARHTKQKN
jgi:hypothetical protein